MQVLARRPLPAISRDVCQGPCSFTIDGDLHVVSRPVTLAVRSAAARIVGPMAGLIQPLKRQIHSSDERDAVVYHHDLLVVRRANRVLVVQCKAQIGICEPIEPRLREPLAVHCIEERRIPA